MSSLSCMFFSIWAKDAFLAFGKMGVLYALSTQVTPSVFTVNRCFGPSGLANHAAKKKNRSYRWAAYRHGEKAAALHAPLKRIRRFCKFAGLSILRMPSPELVALDTKVKTTAKTPPPTT